MSLGSVIAPGGPRRHPGAGRDRSLGGGPDERGVLGQDAAAVARRPAASSARGERRALGRDVEVERLAVDVDDDRVAFLDERDRAAERRLRRDVTDIRPCVPPENRPSVSNATESPRPSPTSALVTASISCIPGPPPGPRSG